MEFKTMNSKKYIDSLICVVSIFFLVCFFIGTSVNDWADLSLYEKLAYLLSIGILLAAAGIKYEDVLFYHPDKGDE